MYFSPGVELKISAYVYHDKSNPKTAELIAHSMEELEKLEQTSIVAERAVVEKINDLIEEWCKQAGETATIRKAKEYLKIGPVEHTSNEWKMADTYRHERSNMVYKMVWWANERTQYDRGLQKSVPVAWDLRWYICYNTIQSPDKTGSGWKIAGQDSKVFRSEADMEKYLQGRIAAYAHLFTEISPPIPKGEEGRFSVNGVLLPGYSKEITVDDLLECLDENDAVGTPAPPPASKKPPAHKRKKHTPTR